MPGTKNTDLRNAQADRLVANLDKMELLDSNGNTIANGDVSWAAASNGEVSPSSSIELDGTANAGTGTDAAEARFYDADGNEEISGLTVTITGAGGDIQLVNTNISENQPVELLPSNVSITEPANTQ